MQSLVWSCSLSCITLNNLQEKSAIGSNITKVRVTQDILFHCNNITQKFSQRQNFKNPLQFPFRPPHPQDKVLVLAVLIKFQFHLELQHFGQKIKNIQKIEENKKIHKTSHLIIAFFIKSSRVMVHIIWIV